MKTRAQYAKLIQIIELCGYIIFICSTLLGLLWDHFLYGLIGGIIVYVISLLVSHPMVEKCQCPHCGNEDVFIRKAGIVISADSICSKCHRKININEKIGNQD